MRRSALARSRYRAAAVLAVVTVVVLALGYVVARDLRQSAEDTNQLYDRLSTGLDFIDEVLFETGEVRRILLYALHTLDANRQLEYAEQSRAAEANVRRLIESRSALSSNPRTRSDVEAVAAAWKQYLVVRDEVIGLILEGSLREGVALDEQLGAARFNAVRGAIAGLKSTFEADANLQVAGQRARAGRATTRLSLIVVSALFATAVGIYLSDRRASLEGLLRSEAHKGSILQAVPDPIISTDDTGHVIELNEAAERTFGVTRAEALGARIDALVVPDDRREALAGLLWAARETSPALPPRIQTVGRRRDGSRFPMELAVAAHTAGRDRICTLHVSDLTDWLQAEEQLRGAKEAAEAAARVESEFLATMSHELRTPLTAVVGIADLLQGAALSATERDLIRMLRSSAATLLGLVNDVLDDSRIEAGLMALRPAHCSMPDLIEQALDPIAEPAARKDLQIGYVVDPDVPDVIADGDRVRQVLINLLSNAVKFTSAGEVAVHVSAQAAAGGLVAITVKVRDTGIGIPLHLHDQLFRRFSQIESSVARHAGGAGLGLAISERLSRLLGGSLTVESREGHGATFTFVFTGRAAETSSARTDAGDGLSGASVLTFLRPGIVADQVESLLRRWGASVVMLEEGLAPPGNARADALLLEADAADGSVPGSVIDHLRTWGLERAPIVTLMRMYPIVGGPPVVPGDVVATPLRAQALYDALCAAVRPMDAPLRRADEPERPFSAGDLAILLVEDNDANRRIVSLMLAELGLDADQAAGGLEAVARAQQRDYDVILMDMQMADIDGLEATRRIRAAQGAGKPPVILALTANVMESDEARCREAGMNGFLSKPLRLATLEQALDSLLSQRS